MHAVSHVDPGVAVDERVRTQHTELEAEAEAVAVGDRRGGHLRVDEHLDLVAAHVDVGHHSRCIDGPMGTEEGLDL